MRDSSAVVSPVGMGQPHRWWVLELQTMGNLFPLSSTLGLKHDCKETGKIPVDCLLDMCMYCIRSDHQSNEDP